MASLQKLSLFGILASALLLFGNVSTAEAWLKVCNSSGESISYHHSEPDSGCGTGNCAWEKVGWWNIANGQCTTVFAGSANNKFFYWYARAFDGSPVWTSSSFQWQVQSSAHATCQCVGCTGGDGNPCFPLYNHRELNTTATNWTLTIFP